MRRPLIILSVSFGATLLVGCGGNAVSPSGRLEAQGLTASRSALSTRSATKSPVYHLLYSFAGYAENDGETPVAGLTDMNGTLYGTTEYGGYGNWGTVFKITASGGESVVHSFTAGSDGYYPVGGLVAVNGKLYGTTGYGGTAGGGTIFEITPSGREKPVFNFAGPNGSQPEAGLIDIRDTLYGTTYDGGPPSISGGTVFGLDLKSKTLSLFYGFLGGSDGQNPESSLIYLNGALYGTTLVGGDPMVGGTVFKINRKSQNEKVFFRFKNATKQGQNPAAGLADVNGVLYGTTENGGAYGRGTVFSVTTSGSESIIHSFMSGTATDGFDPLAGLLNVNGVLYGTTLNGGHYVYGTVFKITTAGKESILYSFKGGDASDGANPQAGLIDVNGTLYGTTLQGGQYGYGTVYSLTL